MKKESQNNLDSDDTLRLSDDIQITSNTISDDRLKIGFGFVTARPHEYLIHIRKGKIAKGTTGQASRCFKRPGDTVIIVPTSLKQLIFQASQLTLDNILIQLRGFAIYHISNPENIYKRINFWDRQAAEKKLALMIGEQCRSHSKWLVANMTLEDCLRKRREAIADVLLTELKIVITEENFGVSIETIDIQDVRIVDENLFEAYQGPASEIIFKNQQLSELERQRDVKTIELEQEQEISKKETETRLKTLADEAQIKQAERLNEAIEVQAQRQMEREDIEHKRALTDFEEEQKRLALQKDAAVEREIKKQDADLKMEIMRERYHIDNSLSLVAMEKMFLEKSLPEIANAIASSLRDTRVTIYQGPDGSGGLPFSMIVNEIMTVLQSRLDRLKSVGLQSKDGSQSDSDIPGTGMVQASEMEHI